MSGRGFFVAERAVTITPSDTVAIAGGVVESIWVGGAGIVVAVLSDDTVVNFTCGAGSVLPVRIKRVNLTSTTATLMVGLR